MMIRALPLLMCLTTACAQFPQVDAVRPNDISPRPEYLTANELAAVKAQRSVFVAENSADGAGEALRAQAEALRSR